jgi:hypothetical protein
VKRHRIKMMSKIVLFKNEKSMEIRKLWVSMKNMPTDHDRISYRILKVKVEVYPKIIK